MSGPQRILWLSIYLAALLLLLAQCINTSEVNTETPNTTQSPTVNSNASNENYELIDVAERSQQAGDKLNVQTGQTTRIFTTEEVDDDFWLKHLGEDFKYAIHLQVGETDQYDGIYNMTEDGANYDVSHDYDTQNYPVEKDDKPSEVNYRSENTPDTSNRREHDQEDAEGIPDNKKVLNQKNDQVDETETRENYEDAEKDFEQIFAIDEAGMDLIKKFNTMKKQKVNYQQGKYIKSPKVQHINIKYTPRLMPQHQHHHQQQQQHQQPQQYQREVMDRNTKQDQNSMPYQKWVTKSSPIVVNLGHHDKSVHQLQDDDNPVVVKMPPVIYHHGMNFDSMPARQTKQQNTEPSQTQSQLNEYIPHSHYSPHYSQQQQQQQQHQQQYENTDYPKYNPHRQKYTSSLSSSSSSLSSSSTPISSAYYNPSLFDESINYGRDSKYQSSQVSSTLAANSSPKEEQQKSSGSIRFILRKPSTPYN